VRRWQATFWLALTWLFAVPAAARDLYQGGGFSSLASDRRAQAPGDVITIVIYENASAVNRADMGSKKSLKLGGNIGAGRSLDETVQLGTSGGMDNAASTGRSGQMIAQMSAMVDEVFPNGDLHVSGEQNLRINGELTHIKLKGRVRASDISSQNAVLSSRLADAAIAYDGSGFVTRSAKPGIVGRIFSFLGLM